MPTEEDAGIDKKRILSEVEAAGASPRTTPSTTRRLPLAAAPPPAPARRGAVPILVLFGVGGIWLAVGFSSGRAIPFLFATLCLAAALGFTAARRGKKP